MRLLLPSVLALSLSMPAMAQDTVTLSLWTRLSEELGSPMFDAFEAANPHINLEVEYIPGGKNQINRLIAAVAAGNAPDIVTLDVIGTEAFTGIDALLRLDDIMAENPNLSADLFPAGPRATGEFDGSYYAIPFGGDASAIAYNRAIFREVGLDPDNPPETWDEFIEAAKALTFDRDGDGRTDVYAIQFVPSQPWLTTFYWLPYFWMAGGEFNDRDAMEFTFDSEAGAEALGYLMSLHLEHGVVPPSAIGAADSADNQLEFLQGRVAMVFDGPGIIARVERDAPDFELGIMTHPRPSADHPLVSFAGGDNISIMANIDEDKLPAAIEVMEWLTSVEGQRAWFESRARLPVRPELLEDSYYAENPNAAIYLRAFLEAHEPPKTAHYVEIQQYLRDAFQQVAFELASPAEALAEAAQRGNALVQRTGRP